MGVRALFSQLAPSRVLAKNGCITTKGAAAVVGLGSMVVETLLDVVLGNQLAWHSLVQLEVKVAHSTRIFF